MFSLPLKEDVVGLQGGGGGGGGGGNGAAVDRASFDTAASLEFPDAARFRMKVEMSLKPAPFEVAAAAVC